MFLQDSACLVAGASLLLSRTSDHSRDVLEEAADDELSRRVASAAATAIAFSQLRRRSSALVTLIGQLELARVSSECSALNRQ